MGASKSLEAEMKTCSAEGMSKEEKQEASEWIQVGLEGNWRGWI